MRFASSFALASLLAAAPVARAAVSTPAVAPALDAAARRAIDGLAQTDGLRLEQRFDAPDGGAVLRYRQLHRGVPVLDGLVVVRTGPDGRVQDVRRGLKTVSVESVAPRLSAARSLELARKARPDLLLPIEAKGRAALVVAPGLGGRLAWLVDVDALIPTDAYTAVIDASAGGVLSLENRARYAGEADVFISGAAARDARRVADGTFDATKLVSRALPGLDNARQGGVLASFKDASAVDPELVTVNCCVYKGCDDVAKEKNTVVGEYMGFKVTTVMCDPKQTALADASGDFRFTPAQEPTIDTAPLPGPSESEPFAEVMVHFAAADELAFLRTLDPAFELRADARPLTATANFLIPNINEALQNLDLATQSTRVETFQRFDNAAYVPKGEAGVLGAVIPGLDDSRDQMIIAQGSTADFGYDPDVVAHEFGHGVVASTAGLRSYAADDWGVLAAPGAMNEAFSDLLAAMRKNGPAIGEYIGEFTAALGEGSLRDLENGFTCPTIISGQVHQDSQHFSAAVWSARVTIAGLDEALRRQFDQAVLTALKQLLPDDTFEAAAAKIAAEVQTSLGADAGAQTRSSFAARGVTGCERVMALGPTNPRSFYVLAPADAARGWTPYAPGPMQFQLDVPVGATAAKVTLKAGEGGGVGGFGQAPPAIKGVLKQNGRIHFAYGNGGVTSDADKTLDFSRTLVLNVPLEASCDKQGWFLALGNAGQAPFTAASVNVSYTVDQAKVATCPGAGGGDGGGSAGGGTDTGDTVETTKSCGCTTGGEWALVALAGLMARRRRSAR